MLFESHFRRAYDVVRIGCRWFLSLFLAHGMFVCNPAERIDATSEDVDQIVVIVLV